jgi:hypothetical protein
MSLELEMRVPSSERLTPPRDGDVVEMSLLLPTQQLIELESAARSNGLTTGQMLRKLINAYLHEPI